MDKNLLTLVALWIHVPVVTVWIGLVMFDLFAVVAPGLDLRQRSGMITWSRPLVVLGVVVIMVTGVWQTMNNPFSDVTSYAELAKLRETTAYGQALFWKHGFVLATFIATIWVRFWLGPRLASAQEPGVQRQVFWWSVVNLAACLGALVLTTRLVWELH